MSLHGQVERAVGLYAPASRYGLVADSRWFENVAEQHIAAMVAALPPNAVVAAQERDWAHGPEMTMAELLVEPEKMYRGVFDPLI